LEARKREIDADLKAQQGDMEIAIHPNLPDLYRRKVARLQQVLDDEAARPQLVEIIRSLIDRIEVHPSKERGHCEVLIVGALATPTDADLRQAAQKLGMNPSDTDLSRCRGIRAVGRLDDILTRAPRGQRLGHVLLYRSYQSQLHGFWRGGLIWLADTINSYVRPKFRFAD